jgi:transposase
VRKRTLANLSKLPDDVIEGLRILLKGGSAIDRLESAFEIQRSLPHGHVAAVLGTLKNIGLESLISDRGSRQRDLVIAMIVARITDPASKLATARGLSTDTCNSTLCEILKVQDASADELYEAMDWLSERQQEIEQRIAAKHLCEGSLILYDVTSTYFEGTTCQLAQYGYSRDKKRGKLQIIFGLLCNAAGCPIAVEVFEGNVNDAKTLSPILEKVRTRFGIQRLVLVGDRGVLTSARIEEELKGVEGLDWITALRAPQIRELVEQEAIQLSLFDQKDLAAIQSPDYPGERLIACRNPFLAEERATTREALLQATEKELDKIVTATTRSHRRLVGAEKIGVRVGKIINRYQVAKHFILKITDNSFSYSRNSEKIEAEAKLDGMYVIRTSVAASMLDDSKTVKAYKSLSQVEQAFRCYKTIDLKVRPIYHRLAHRVRSHVFLCLLAYYVEWQMRERLAPLLFEEEELLDPEAEVSVVVPVKSQTPARRKASTKRTSEHFPVQSFRTLLTNLSTIAKNRVQPKLGGVSVSFDKLTIPTPLQQKALDLLGVSLIL